jgi:hypothetical protein
MTRDNRELAAAQKMPSDALDHREGMVTRLWIPVRLYPTVSPGEGDIDPLRRLFNFAAGEEIARGANWSLIGRCPRCWEFFYRVRRQRYCSSECKQAAMDEAKRERRRAKKRKGR